MTAGNAVDDTGFWPRMAFVGDIPVPRHRFAARSSVSGLWAALDTGMLGLAVLWMSEALVRLPIGPEVTALVYGYFSLRIATWIARDGGPEAPVVLAILPFPALCLASALWSLAPEVSAVAAVQLTFTLILALWAGSAIPLRRLAWILTLALGGALAVSAMNLAALWTPAYSWERGFLGVFTNKNALGQRAALTFVAALALMLASRGRIEPVIAAGIAALALWMLVLSLSVTGLVLGSVAGATVVVLAIWGARRSLGLIALILGLGAVAAALFWAGQIQVDIVTLVLEGFGKSHSLTGRTFLWASGWDVVAEAPLAGHGYMAFWVAEATAQQTAITAELYGATVQSFHNFALEILVATGVPGLLAFAVLLIAVGSWIARAPRGHGRRWAAITCLLLVALSALGSSLYRPHEISLFLLVAIGIAARTAAHRSGASYSRI